MSGKLSETGTNLDNYFTALTDLKKFNGVVLAIKDDTVVLEKAYNIYSNPDSTSFISTDHQFDIHSVAKLMTHYLLLKLKSAGVLSENDAITKFFPDFPRGEQITIEMLIDHQSGLPRELLGFEGNEIDLTTDEIVALAKDQELIFEPGEDIQYSNVGYELLYNIISKAYAKSFAQTVVDEIFIPLGMTHSGAHFYTDGNRPEKLALNHTIRDSMVVRVPNILEGEFKTARFYAKAADLNVFLNQLKDPSIAKMLKNENGIIAKDGGSKGIRAQVYLDLNNNFQFVLLANYDEMPFFDTIEDVVKILKSEPFEIPRELNRKAIELEEEILKKYVGEYSFADFDDLTLRVAIEDGELVIFQGEEKIALMKAESETVFFEDPKASESFEFVRNESGTFDALMGWKGITVEGKRK